MSVYVDINAGDGILSADRDGRKFVYRFKKGEWTDNASPFIRGNPKFMRSKIYAEWNPAGNEFEATVWFYETPVRHGFKLRFSRSKNRLAFTFGSPGSLVSGEGDSLDLEFVKGSDVCL
jgi:hypothetical protein